MISQELDALGAEYNAFTGEEYTGYYAKAEVRHTDKILELVSDLYVNPVFDGAEMEKEKGVIIEELNMYEDTPMRKVQEVFTELLYGDQPAGWPIGGHAENIRRMTREDILNYRKLHYVANSTVVVVAGGFDEKDIVKKIEEHFTNVLVGEKGQKVATKDEQSKPKVQLQFKETDQTHIVLGVRAYKLSDERKYALEVLATVLGGGMSSRLFQKVRDELGAAYYVKADVTPHTDHGYFEISAGLDHKKLKIVIEALLGEMKKLTMEEVRDEEWKKVQNLLAGRTVLGLETSDALAAYYGGQEVLERKVATPAEELKKIMAVTPKDVLAVAKDIFKEEKLNLAMIGPYKDGTEFEKILKF
jgi:predicted Zn-dependent peptidase